MQNSGGRRHGGIGFFSCELSGLRGDESFERGFPLGLGAARFDQVALDAAVNQIFGVLGPPSTPAH